MSNQKDDASARVEPGVSLPRGRHGLPPDVVERHQRERVAAAVSRILADRGYSALTVEALLKSAGISRSTFYVHFANKQEAVLVAYDLALERFTASLAEDEIGQADRSQRVRSAISTALRFARLEPEQAQLLSGYSLCGDPLLARRVFESHDQLALLLCASEDRVEQPPDLAGRALVGAVTSILARHLIAGESRALADLESRLVALVLSPYLGPKAAAGVAEGIS